MDDSHVVESVSRPKITVKKTTQEVIADLVYWRDHHTTGTAAKSATTMPYTSVLHAIDKLQKQMEWIEEFKEELRDAYRKSEPGGL